VSQAGDSASIVLEGRITAYTASPVWQAALNTLAKNPERPVIVDASRLEYIDDVGIALLFDPVPQGGGPGAQIQAHRLGPTVAGLVADYDPKDFVEPPKLRPHIGIFEHLGRATVQQLAYTREMLAFLEDCAGAAWGTFRGRGSARWGEVLDIATEAGANAVPI